jgi:hypothetical protein
LDNYPNGVILPNLGNLHPISGAALDAAGRPKPIAAPGVPSLGDAPTLAMSLPASVNCDGSPGHPTDWASRFYQAVDFLCDAGRQPLHPLVANYSSGLMKKTPANFLRRSSRSFNSMVLP